MKSYEVYHTQEFRATKLHKPIWAEGVEQWLGDGFYFWQDYEFAEWWGEMKKCSRENLSRKFSIYKVKIEVPQDSFIDTVFNEEDYYNFVGAVERFAKKYAKRYKKKPTLEEFNDFIHDFNVWDEIKAIRFQDLPENDRFIDVKKFYYKKRIQFRVNDLRIIATFTHLKNLDCVN